MAYDKVSPFVSRVWFEGGAKVPARVVGIWNNAAVAQVTIANAHKLFKGVARSTTVIEDGRYFRVALDNDLDFSDLRIIRGRVVDLGDGWSLSFSKSRLLVPSVKGTRNRDYANHPKKKRK